MEPAAQIPDGKLNMRVIKARHDLHNSIGHVLGFSEMLLEQAQEQGQDDLSLELQRLVQSAQEITAHINEDLLASKIEAGLSNLDGLERLLCLWAAEVIESVEILTRAISARPDENFETDLVRIAGAANRTRDLAKTSLKNLATPVAGETVLLQRAITPLLDLLPDRSSTTTFSNVRKQGSILVVDDLAENRELLSRRLARLGYSVRVVESGRQALDGIAIQPPELILLDILMPELDGFEILRQLKANALTQHIPVIMLSSSDQAETAVRCIELGADDFLPKPFNPTLLVARIESSLAKKRLRDQETDFLKYLQNERELSDRLLLNILPQPVAERLKQGERTIADSFSDVTVLFSDLVAFTRLASDITPRDLVARLNEIFSAFDDLCEHYGLEKIKMIGDAYMAVGGLPEPKSNHARAAADLALAMQRETARLGTLHSQPLRMRVGLSTGPVIAGVIGSKKFAYDLWGDTVNLASRLEAHAPPGTVLVSASTYELLRSEYVFQPGRLIQVKGKGEVMAYPLIARR